jgi:hypothetical protein
MSAHGTVDPINFNTRQNGSPRGHFRSPSPVADAFHQAASVLPQMDDRTDFPITTFEVQ